MNKSSYFLLLAGIIYILQAGKSFAVIQSDVVVRWNYAAMRSLHNSNVGEPTASRALAIVQTCMYDAWTAYDGHATGTQLSGALRRPTSEQTLANKEKAISYAAYRALADVLPADTESVYKPLMKQLGYDPNDHSTDIETPAGIGNVACAAVLEFRHYDKSNQLGDLSQGPYSDWTYFRPVNMPVSFPIRLPSIHPIDLNHWEPLVYVDPLGNFMPQMFTMAYWSHVTPFALLSADEFREIAKSFPPASYGSPGYRIQAEELVRLSAGLTDEQKMIAEYWSNDSDAAQVPIHWNEFAEWVSAKDHHTLDEDVKMFFALNNALLDASIAAWDMKRTYDTMRPVTAIPILFQQEKIRAWGGPGKGTVEMNGANWIPYQPSSLPTPASPEYVSGTSTLSSAAASILEEWTGSDRFGDSISFPAGSSRIEPGKAPARAVTLQWNTFTDAADQAGISGRYAGIHFRRGDLAGRELGRLIAAKAWSKATTYFEGTAPAGVREQKLATRALDKALLP